MALPVKTLDYLLTALATTPTIVLRLIGRIPSSSPIWDERPDPNRFTPREVVAHLADWETVFQERLMKTVAECEPELPNLDEWQIAQDRHYSTSIPQEQAVLFLQRRTELIRYLRSLPSSAWDLAGTHSHIGRMTLTDQVVQIAGHDGYHLAQIVAMPHE